MKRKPIIAITMGDPAGIGPEVIMKSLASPEIRKICQPVVIGSFSILARITSLLHSAIPMESRSSFADFLMEDEMVPVLDCTGEPTEDIQFGFGTPTTGEAAVSAIKIAVDLALREKVAAIVTGPISKHVLHQAGYHVPGQTEFLAELTGSSAAVMMLVSPHLKVALVTTHCSVAEVASLITIEAVVKNMSILDSSLRTYFGIDTPRIAVLSLNPHAGDGGIFGREEADIIEPAIEQARSSGIQAFGPVPADTVFVRWQTNLYDAYLAMYHDQALIPFKMAAFGKGVNITLGLPIIRTSPDHGTAFDIAGKGLADPGSMTEAIRLAASVAVRKNAARAEL